MPWDIDKVIEETKAFLATGASQEELDKIDWSYITQELLDGYEQDAVHKDADASSSAVGGWCFYGHHYAFKDGWRYFTNSNTSSGCDRPDDKCFGKTIWIAKMQIAERNPPPTCPSNSLGFGSTTIRGK